MFKHKRKFFNPGIGALFATGAGGGQQRPPGDEEDPPEGDAAKAPAEDADEDEKK